MHIMVILIGFSLFIALCFLVLFLLAVRSGQYDDQHTPAIRMLFDDTDPKSTRTKISPPEAES
ncbi:MAG: cbb3-type cytochrome oxidase assembly protein CcoS [Fidelibacterota bacterium]|nr:MAG: cbb3-type cytochrome oxidase assembly protein CcoS [Candidatus Neomarinimicrobiota bacterium]